MARFRKPRAMSIQARMWRLRIAGLAETVRLREAWTLCMVEG